MIRRLYIDGYKAFVNHTIEFDRLVFLAGGNGTGKSGHFDVLSAVRGVAYEGRLVHECFPKAVFSQFAWLDEPRITIEVDAVLASGIYRYRLVVGQSVLGIVIEEERLSRGEEEAYHFANGKARLSPVGSSVTEVSLAAYRSGLPVLSMGTQAAIFFLSELANAYILRLNPFDMEDVVQPSGPFMRMDGGNFVSWLSREMADFTKAKNIVTRWQEALGVPVNPSFDPQEAGGRFKLDLRYGLSTQFASLSDLSEGQRCLLVVHALLATAESRGGLFMLDEPDNFLSYAEVRGLITDIQSASLHEQAQIILASHNPALMRSLGGVYGYRFYRDPAGHIRYTDLAVESEGVYADLVVADGEIGD